MMDFINPTVDCKVARSMGGKDEISNYVIVCRKATQFKSDMGLQRGIGCIL